MAKSFANKLNQDAREVKKPATTKTTKAAATKTTAKKAAEKRGVGRPKVKSEECKTVNIAIPVSVLEKIEIAKAKYNSNMTEYINAAIAKDLEANYKDYKKIYDLIHS